MEAQTLIKECEQSTVSRSLMGRTQKAQMKRPMPLFSSDAAGSQLVAWVSTRPFGKHLLMGQL